MKKFKIKLTKRQEKKLYISLIACSVILVTALISPSIYDTVGQLGNEALTMFGFKELADEAKYIGDTISGVEGEAKKELEAEGFVFGDTISEQGQSEVSTDNAVVSAENTGTLVRVVDGDTYVINIGGVDTKVRLIGVDTPESVAPASYSKDNSAEGKDVSDIMKDKLQKGDVLTVEYDVQKTDKYNRTLAYVYFSDGTMIQKWLLENGYAQCMTIQPNSKYATEFAEIQHKAAENSVGLWNGYFEE